MFFSKRCKAFTRSVSLNKDYYIYSLTKKFIFTFKYLGISVNTFKHVSILIYKKRFSNKEALSFSYLAGRINYILKGVPVLYLIVVSLPQK